MQIIILGPPGAGKGTQAKTLAQKLNIPHISTGDLLRQNVSKNNELGKLAKDFMEKGALVPDTLVTQMLIQRVDQANIKNGFILDGYPRNITQAQELDAFLKKINSEIEFVIDLNTSIPVIIQRLTGRLVCSRCGINFHIRNMPPKKENTCDNCGASLYQRADDNEETIKKRLEVYNKEFSPIIKYYEEKQKLHRFDANQESEIVLNKILNMIQEHDDSLKV